MVRRKDPCNGNKKNSFHPEVVIASEAKQSRGLDCVQDYFHDLIFFSFCEMLSRVQHPESVAEPCAQFFARKSPLSAHQPG